MTAMRPTTRYRQFRLPFLLMVSLSLAPTASAQNVPDGALKETVNTLKELSKAAKQAAKAKGAPLTGRSAGKIAGPLDSMVTLLTNSDKIACSYLIQVARAKHLELTSAVLDGGTSGAELKTYQDFLALKDRLEKVCDPIIQEYAQGDDESEGDDSAVEEEENEETEGSSIDRPPYHLSRDEKKCWPLCKSAWYAMDGSAARAETAATAVAKARVEASEAERFLAVEASRLERGPRSPDSSRDKLQ